MDFRKKRPGEDTAELEQIKQMIRDLPEEDGGPEYTVESIMAEERFAAVTRRGRSPAPEPSPAPPDSRPRAVRFPEDEPEDFDPSGDTRRIEKIAEEMRSLARDAGWAERAAHRGTEPVSGPEASFSVKIRDSDAAPEPEENLFLNDEMFKDAFRRAEPAGGAADTEDSFRGEDYDEPSPPRSARDLLQALKDHIRKPLPPLEAMPQQAYARVAPYAAFLKARAFAAFVLALPLLYAALGPLLELPMPEWLIYARQPYRYLLITGVLHGLIMLCAVDVVARGLSDLFHLRPGPETLITLAGVATLAHTLTLLLPSFELSGYAAAETYTGFIGYTPYTAVSGVGFFFAVWAAYYQYGAYRRTYKTAMEAEEDRARLITLEEDLWDGMDGYTKREGSLEGFVTRTEAPDVARRAASLLAPLLMVASLVFATVSSVGQGRPGHFFWAWSAISLAAVPPCALFVFALPFARVAKRLSVKGGAIAGWTAAREMKGGQFAAARDEDFFPTEMVSLNGLKIFNNYPYDKVTSYAAAMLETSGSSLRHAVRELVRGREDQLPPIDRLEHHEAGGISGEAGRDRVMMGTSDFILHMSIRLPRDLIIKKAVYLIVNSELAGIFAVNYIPSSATEGAALKLVKNGVTPLMAVRDFNITPALLKEKYTLDTDILEYPPVEDRLALSDKGRDTLERPSAFVTRDGLSPIAECVIGAVRLRRVARINLWISLLCTAASVLGMFYFTYIGTADAALSILPGNVMLYFLIWWIPGWICSAAAHRY
ncbi:MAG: hypothetical protein FWG93_02455 [Oscillospiraceae bacterium]|nr:hypothetical protein [Oscillospiraceae bacterium]